MKRADKRSTYGTLDVENLTNGLLSQKGDQDMYKVTGRDTAGNLICTIGSTEELKDKYGNAIVTDHS